jgi:hypothetical protein
LRLYDLDASAWDRFPPPTVAELAELVLQKLSDSQTEPAFPRSRLPVVPAGLDLDDLPLEDSTREELLRAGLKGCLENLSERSLGELLAGGVGLRSLVDLLCALEAAAGRKEEKSRPAPELYRPLTAAAKRLAQLPDAAAVKADDPRFGRLLKEIAGEGVNAAVLAERLLARGVDPPNPRKVAQQLKELCRRIENALRCPLEEELTEIFAAEATPRNRDIIRRYYGWEDGQRHTLNEVGIRYGVTRERIRQLCDRLTRQAKRKKPIFAPVLERTLTLIGQRLPCSAATLEAELVAARLTRVGMSLEAVADAAQLLDRPEVFRIVTVEDARLAFRSEDAAHVLSIVEQAQKDIYFHGVSTVERIRKLVQDRTTSPVLPATIRRTLPFLAGFAWLDQRHDWFCLLRSSKHGLPRIVEKVLAVAGETTLRELRAAICRQRRFWKEPPPEKIIRAYCQQIPGIRIERNRVIAERPRDWRRVLMGMEALLVKLFKRHGPLLERNALEKLCVSHGVNRYSFNTFLYCSPVIKQFALGVYGLIGTKVSREEVEKLSVISRTSRCSHRVLQGYGRTAEGKIWIEYRLSAATGAFLVITIPAPLKKVLQGRFRLLNTQGEQVGTLATRDGRGWGLGRFLRRAKGRPPDHIVLTFDLEAKTILVTCKD